MEKDYFFDPGIILLLIPSLGLETEIKVSLFIASAISVPEKYPNSRITGIAQTASEYSSPAMGLGYTRSSSPEA